MLPEYIKCIVTSNDKLVSGLALKVKLRVNAKNSYDFIIGPTDSNGIAAIAKPSILEQANQQMSIAIMDYHPIEDVFSGVIEAHIMKHNELECAIEAFNLFKNFIRFPSGYFEMLRKCCAVAKGGISGLTLITVVSPPEFKVISLQQKEK